MISVNYVNVPRVERKTELVFSPTSCTKLTVFQPGSIVILIEPHCSGHVSPIRRRSDYIIGFIAPAIGPNKSRKLTRLAAPAHNILVRGKV